jgi:nucleoside-diphosphate-sugar epimerase
LDDLSTGKIENIQCRLKDVKFNFVKGDVQNSRDVNGAINTLGYKPRVTLEKGLERLLNEDKCGEHS